MRAPYEEGASERLHAVQSADYQRRWRVNLPEQTARIQSLRTVLHQYNRAMHELGWTMADIRALDTLADLERELQRLRNTLQANADLLVQAEDELQRLRESAEVSRKVALAEAEDADLYKAEAQQLEQAIQRVLSEAPYLDGPEKEILRAALSGRENTPAPDIPHALEALLDDLGSPYDIDQDCRHCGKHYHGHHDDCPWMAAAEALARAGGRTFPTDRYFVT